MTAPSPLDDLLAEFPMHSEWECGGRRLTAVGINSRLTAVLTEHDHILLRVPIEDARATWTRVVPTPPCPIRAEMLLDSYQFGCTSWLADWEHVPGLVVTLHPAGTVLPEGTPHGVYTWNGGTS